MQKRKGFTLVELMVVILIVGILAAVAIPLMRGRVDSAKWSEGKAVAGTIASALRAYTAEKGAAGTYPPTMAQLGFTASDLTGTYFTTANYSIASCTYNEASTPPLQFSIQVTKPATITTGTSLTLSEAGVFAGGPE
jgi:type IV pilus assembly protein PilA